MTVGEMACRAARGMAAFNLQLLRPLVTRECGMIAQVSARVHQPALSVEK